jgi:hypothetical protein
MTKNMTRKEKLKFEKLNAIHPRKQTPLEKYEFYLLLGKIYLGNANRKTKKYTQSQKKFNRDQGNYALKKAENIKKRYKLNDISAV